MTYRELTQKLRRLGCEFRRQAKGGHEVWCCPQRNQYTTISYHGRKDIPEGTLAAILRDPGLSKQDLDKL